MSENLDGLVGNWTSFGDVLNFSRNDRRLKVASVHIFCWLFRVPEAGVEQSRFEQGDKALSKSGGTPSGTLATDSDSVASLRQQALDDLQRAWKSLRRLEDLADVPAESNAAGRAVAHVDKAFAELEGGKR